MLHGVTMGFNGPPIVRDGQIVPLKKNLEDSRVKADARNVVDYTAGKEVPGSFFQDIRKMLPSYHAFDRMTRNEPTSAVVRTPVPQSEEERAPFERLAQTIQEEGFSHLRMDTKNGDYRLGILGKLPEQKMPFMGYGRNREGELLIVAVDGRQACSTGVSISQLGRIMKEKGAVDAILTCGGGDVAVVAKTDGQTRVLNSPANKDASGTRTTRQIPNLVIIR